MSKKTRNADFEDTLSIQIQQALDSFLQEQKVERTTEALARRVITLRNDLASTLARASGWLSPAEKIFILQRTSNWATIRLREKVDLLMAAGCYLDAIPLLEEISHWRKIGDAQLALGNIDSARQFYERGENKKSDVYAAFRVEPDYDRLIALAIGREDWLEAIDLVRRGQPDPLGKADVIFAGSNRAKGPLVKLCAHAAWKSGNESILADMPKLFGISATELKTLFANASSGSFEREVAKLGRPDFLKTKPETLARILEAGDTPDAEQVINFFNTLEAGYTAAIDGVRKWRESGDNMLLDSALFWLTSTGNYQFFSCCLFQMRCDLDVWNDPHPTDTELYIAHPWLTRECLPELLAILIQEQREPTPAVLLSCAFQHFASPFDLDFEKLDAKDRIMEQVRGQLTWAENVVERWSTSGSLTHHWPKVCANADPKGRLDPRRVPAYAVMCDEVIETLRAAWARDFNDIRWKAEEGVFLALKSLLLDASIVRHARPNWLAPQHLDIFLPEYGIAIEYQGEQHYRPIEIFGGERGLAATIERDRRKKRICELAGVQLEYIRYDESVDERLKQIVESCRSKLETTRRRNANSEN